MASTSEFIPSESPSEFDSLANSFAELLARSRRGSATSLGELLESSRKYLLTVAERKLDGELRGKIGASDLVQDTFIEAHKDFARFRGTTERELFAWLSAMLTNRFLDAARRYRCTQKRAIARETRDEAAQQILSNLPCAAPTPRTSLLVQEDRRRLEVAFARLPDTVRQILVMRIWNRRTFAEIGELCNCSSEAARKRFLRAVEEMRGILEQPGCE